MEEKSGFRDVIKNPGFINLWLNQILVQLSYNSLNFALIIWVFKLTNSSTAVSALLFTIYLPAILLGLFAGVVVDVIDKKNIIVAVNVFMALAFISLIFLKDYYPILLLVTFIINSLAQFYIPTESSAIPMVVKGDQLLQANSLFSTTLFMTFLVGYGLSGPIIDFLGINYVFGLGAVALLFAFLLGSRFPSLVSRSDRDAQTLIHALHFGRMGELHQVVVHEIRETLAMIRGRMSVVTSILIMAGVQVIIGVMAVVMPSFLERVLLINATNASYVLITPLGMGMIIGALLVGKRGHRLPRRALVGRAFILGGLILFLMGALPLVAPIFPHFARSRSFFFIHQPSQSLFLTVGSFILGAAMVSIIIPSQTIIQESSPKEYRGKVFSVLAVAMSAFSVIPVLFAGALADIFGALPIFIGLGGIILFLGLFTLRPDFFFDKHHLPHHIREFLGLGHWGE